MRGSSVASGIGDLAGARMGCGDASRVAGPFAVHGWDGGLAAGGRRRGHFDPRALHTRLGLSLGKLRPEL